MILSRKRLKLEEAMGPDEKNLPKPQALRKCWTNTYRTGARQEILAVAVSNHYQRIDMEKKPGDVEIAEEQIYCFSDHRIRKDTAGADPCPYPQGAVCHGRCHQSY